MSVTEVLHTILELVPLVTGVLVLVITSRAGRAFTKDSGWRLVISGLSLLVFASVIDLLEDMFIPPQNLIIIRTFMESIAGDTLAFILIGVGLKKWLPKLIANDRAKKALEESHKSLVKKLDSNIVEVNEFKKRLIDQVSHDLKTPLSGIIGCMEIILGMDMTDEQKKYIDEVNRSSDDMLTIIEKMKNAQSSNPDKVIKSHFKIRESLQNIYTTLKAKNLDNDKNVFMHIESTIPHKVYGPKLYFEAFFTHFIECLYLLDKCEEILINIYSGLNDNFKTYINIQVALNGEGCEIDLENPSEDKKKVLSILESINGSMSIEELESTGNSVYNVAIPFSLVE